MPQDRTSFTDAALSDNGTANDQGVAEDLPRRSEGIGDFTYDPQLRSLNPFANRSIPRQRALESSVISPAPRTILEVAEAMLARSQEPSPYEAVEQGTESDDYSASTLSRGEWSSGAEKGGESDEEASPVQANQHAVHGQSATIPLSPVIAGQNTRRVSDMYSDSSSMMLPLPNVPISPSAVTASAGGMFTDAFSVPGSHSLLSTRAVQNDARHLGHASPLARSLNTLFGPTVRSAAEDEQGEGPAGWDEEIEQPQAEHRVHERSDSEQNVGDEQESIPFVTPMNDLTLEHVGESTAIASEAGGDTLFLPPPPAANITNITTPGSNHEQNLPEHDKSRTLPSLAVLSGFDEGAASGQDSHAYVGDRALQGVQPRIASDNLHPVQESNERRFQQIASEQPSESAFGEISSPGREHFQQITLQGPSAEDAPAYNFTLPSSFWARDAAHSMEPSAPVLPEQSQGTSIQAASIEPVVLLDTLSNVSVIDVRQLHQPGAYQDQSRPSVPGDSIQYDATSAAQRQNSSNAVFGLTRPEQSSQSQGIESSPALGLISEDVASEVGSEVPII